jgi:AraC-like DNA-binding protein
MKIIRDRFFIKNNEIPKEIERVVTPDIYYGGPITSFHRIVLFNQISETPIYIDCVPHCVEMNHVYIIPDGHILYIPYELVELVDFVIIEIPINNLNDFLNLGIHKWRYRTRKSFFVQGIDIDAMLVESTCKKNVVKILASEFKKNTQNNLVPLDQHYIALATQFRNCIYNSDITYLFTVDKITDGLYISNSTLWRMCNNVFELSPRAVIRFHLVIKSIFLLSIHTNKSVEDIAYLLDFNEHTTFSRYIKGAVGLTPTEIRKQYHLLLKC